MPAVIITDVPVFNNPADQSRFFSNIAAGLQQNRWCICNKTMEVLACLNSQPDLLIFTNRSGGGFAGLINHGEPVRVIDWLAAIACYVEPAVPATSYPEVDHREAFWLVWAPDGISPPRHRHETQAAAEREAERLARDNPGRRFYVMESRFAVETFAMKRDRFAPAAITDDMVPF